MWLHDDSSAVLSLRLNLIAVWICQSGTFILCFQIPSLEKTHIQFWQEKLRKDGRRKSADERNAQRSAWTLNNFAKAAAANSNWAGFFTQNTFDHQPKRILLHFIQCRKGRVENPVFFPLSHTIRKVKFLSKNSILTTPQLFHEFFHPNLFWQFFSWNQSCQELKWPKPQHFHEFFT